MVDIPKSQYTVTCTHPGLTRGCACGCYGLGETRGIDLVRPGGVHVTATDLVRPGCVHVTDL